MQAIPSALLFGACPLGVLRALGFAFEDLCREVSSHFLHLQSPQASLGSWPYSQPTLEASEQGVGGGVFP